MTGANTLELTDDNFESEVVQSDRPVLVDFWAEWCAPCRMLSPMIDELANEYAAKIKVGKVNTDASGRIAAQFGISAIPTVIFFREGQPVKKFVGMKTKRDLRNAIEEVLVR
jgi:thioredoxin 1